MCEAARWASTSTSIFMQTVAGGGYANNNIGWNARRTCECVCVCLCVKWDGRVGAEDSDGSAWSIRGSRIASDDGIFQNVKTNIANPRRGLLWGWVISTMTGNASPSFQRRLDILLPSRTISGLLSFFTSSYSILSATSPRRAGLVLRSPSSLLCMSFVCMYMECYI